MSSRSFAAERRRLERGETAPQWSAVRTRELPALLSSLAPREWGCVPFTSRLLRGESVVPLRLSRSRILGARDGHGAFIGAVLVTRSGMVFPSLDPELLSDTRSRTAVASLLTLRPVTMLMGVASQVDVLSPLIPQRRTHMVEYHLMTLERSDSFIAQGDAAHADNADNASFSIRRADMRDLPALLPLQSAYEIEEVILPGRSVRTTTTARNLAYRLQQQLVYLAGENGRPVAMAGTNARGLRFDQVGGVYTLPEYRNRGVSRFLMKRLISDAAAANKQLCLFVKPGNQAACALYQRLGFTIRDRFAISYYSI